MAAKGPTLAEIVAATPADQRGPKCTIGKLLRRLDDDMAAELRTMLDAEVSHTVLAKAVTAWCGVRVTDEMLSRHRRQVCRCSG